MYLKKQRQQQDVLSDFRSNVDLRSNSRSVVGTSCSRWCVQRTDAIVRQTDLSEWLMQHTAGQIRPGERSWGCHHAGGPDGTRLQSKFSEEMATVTEKVN